MADNVTGQSTDGRVLHGNLGATTDIFFLINGNFPNHQIGIRGQDGETELSLSEADGGGDLPLITVVGHFLEEVSSSDPLRRFVVARFVPHTTIAERAFAIFASGTGGTAEQNWLLAERNLASCVRKGVRARKTTMWAGGTGAEAPALTLKWPNLALQRARPAAAPAGNIKVTLGGPIR